MMLKRYFASIGLEVDKSSVAKVDKTLDHVEKRLMKLGTFANKPIVLNIGNFDVDQRKLNMALGNALDIASNRLVFEVSHFTVNQAALNRSVGSALNRASTQPLHVNQRVNSGAARTATGAAVGGGLIGRGISGFYGPALALGLGGYGLGALNQRNQQVVSAQLQSSAVVQQAGGTAQQGADSFQYLRSEGQRIGFNYLDASGDYNKLISGLTGSGVSLKESQKVFSGFAELARVNKLDKTTQNRLFRALSQVAGKGKLQSEELTGQIAEALPGGTALFAEAYQRQIGGNKTGADAIQQLLADMKKGKVTSDILTYAGAAASARANQGGALGAASQASQAEQARYQNSVNDLAVLASNSGVEEGFARIFRTLNAGLSESGSLVRGLSEGFNEATKWADDLLLWPQSFARALEGKDSLVGDWLGYEKTKELQESWKQIQAIWKDITSMQEPSWMPTLLATTKELAGILDRIAKLKSTSDQAQGIIQEEYQNDPTLWGNVKGLAKANLFTFENTLDAINPFDLTTAKRNWGGWLGIDSWKNATGDAPLVQSVDDINSQASDAAKASAEDKAMGITNNNDLTINLTIDPVTLGNMDIKGQAEALANEVGQRISVMFEQASVQFPIKE